MDEFKQLLEFVPFARKLGLFVYIEEAHASDEWPIGSKTIINQHQTNNDRKDCLLKFTQTYPWIEQIFVCSYAKVESKISKSFNVWPFGLWLIKNNVVVDQLLPHKDTTFNIGEFVKKFIKMKSRDQKIL